MEQASDQGYDVRAFVRNPKKLNITNEKLTLVEGVIVALGASPNMQEDIVMEEGTNNIINAMSGSLEGKEF